MSAVSTDRSDRPTIRISLTVNGRLHELTIEPRDLLLEVLRDRLGATGTKLSCDVEVCGACTVLLDGRPVSACTLLAYEARNRDVVTIEGLADGDRLHPLQQAFIDHAAFQCGFCTPGMILAAKSLLDTNPAPTTAEIKHYMRGNICRCTGYKKILEAIQAAGEQMRSGAQERLTR